MNYYELSFNGDGIMDQGVEFAALMPSADSRREALRRKREAEKRTVRDVSCFMALVVGVAFFVLSYL